MHYAPVHIKTFSRLRPCLQEEADARIMLHIADCVHEDLNNIVIRTIDTDVVVLVVAMLGELSIDELWIAFGTANHSDTSVRISLHITSELISPEHNLCFTA